MQALREPIPEPLRILLVEDEAPVLKICKALLESGGHEVVAVPGAEPALEQLERGEVDLVVSDLVMGGMDGLELLQRVRARRPTLPFVLVSAAASAQELSERLGAMAPTRFLAKPFDRLQLLQAVHELTGEGRPPAPVCSVRERQFRKALEKVRLAFQPIVSCADRRVVAYEALMRSGEPRLANPLALLEAAEAVDGVPELGRCVRREAAGALGGLRDGTLVFVNLHPHELADEELLSPAAPLSTFAGRVVLEVTERARLEGIPDLKERIAALRRMGYRFAVDDMGSGYSGLSALIELEPEVVKMDMGLVRGVDESSAKRRVIRSLLSMCRETGTVVVAEGVETARERDTLVRLGCDLLQGYFFSKPAPPFVAIDDSAYEGLPARGD